MRKWVVSSMFALALALCAPFAFAIDVCKHVVCRFAEEYEGYGKADAKFKAEVAANMTGRTSEAVRANGLVKMSNHFAMSGIVARAKAVGLPLKVGWQGHTAMNAY